MVGRRQRPELRHVFAFSTAADGHWGAYMDKNDPNFINFKVGSSGTVPEPSDLALTGLGLLALGAAGVREFRRRRATAAS